MTIACGEEGREGEEEEGFRARAWSRGCRAARGSLLVARALRVELVMRLGTLRVPLLARGENELCI